MGTTTSKPRQKTKQQEDIAYLGERFPFGDEELLRFYQCASFLGSCQNRISFLTDWAVHVGGSSRCKSIQIVEHSILPPNFGQTLERIAFTSRSRSYQNEDSAIPRANENVGLQDLTNDSREAAMNGSTSRSTSTICCCCTSRDTGGTEEQMQLLKQATLTDVEMDHLEAFLDGASNCSRRGGRAALTVLFNCCSSNGKAKASELIDLGYRIAVASLFLQQAALVEEEDLQDHIPSEQDFENESLQSLSKSLTDHANRYRQGGYSSMGSTNDDSEDALSLDEFLEWSESTAPLLSSSLSTFLHCIFFFDKPYPPSRTALMFPRIDNTSAFFRSPTSPMLFSFACMSSSLGGTWHRLYTSESDGLSFNRLQLSLLGYGGPTLLVIRSTTGGIFGAFTASAWKETRDFYGNSDCFLFQSRPKTKVYRPSGSGRNFMYCNSEARSKGYDGLAHGIGFGGTTDQPRLFIDETFDNCVASAADLTFDNGPLLHAPANDFGSAKQRSFFDIDALEVWGVGGQEVVEQALGARLKQRELTAANIRKARKVDKAAFLEDFQSGLIASKAFQHRDQIRGRADVSVDEKHKKEYVYED